MLGETSLSSFPPNYDMVLAKFRVYGRLFYAISSLSRSFSLKSLAQAVDVV